MRRVIVDRTKRIFDDFFKVDEAYLRYERFDGTMSPVVRRLISSAATRLRRSSSNRKPGA